MSTARDLDRRAHALLRQLIDAEPETQRQLIDEACAEDEALRSEVERLLEAMDPARDFLNEPAFGKDLRSIGPQNFVGTRIGGFVLEELLGTGGMGTVFRARQEEPSRQVAIKLMNPGLLDQKALQRFRDEARALARLEHPGIARLYMSGTWDAGFGGVPWYAMELVEGGEAITDHASRRKLDRITRLALFQSVCDAVHAGHQRGVIHRDLKPANILVDREGTVRLIDFGVARVLGGREVTRTAFAGIVGTVPYMSPEQFRGDSADLDVRSDVFALGVLLYELITGGKPYDLEDTSFIEAARRVCETSPTRPSQVDPTVPHDLEAIVLKAMARECEDRYQTVAELKEDVQYFLESRPVRARPPTRWKQMTLFARRHRALVTLSGLSIAVLVTAAVVSTWLAILLQGERDKQIRLAFRANVMAAEGEWRAGEIQAMRRRLELATPELRDWEWYFLDRLARFGPEPRRGHTDRVMSISWAPDGSRFASGARDGFVRIWERETESSTALEVDGIVTVVAWSVEGEYIAVGVQSGRVQIIEVRSGHVIQTVRLHRGRVSGLAFTPDGTLWSCSADGAVRSLVPGSDSSQILGEGLGIQRDLCLDPEGSLATTGDDGTVRIWNLSERSLAATFQLPDHALHAIALHPDGKELATGGNDGAIHRWSLAGDLLQTIPAHPSVVRDLSFSSSGRWLASGSGDRTLAVWDWRDGSLLGRVRLFELGVHGVEFQPGSDHTLACGSWDRTVWQFTLDEVLNRNALEGHEDEVQVLAFAQGGSVLASGAEDGTVLLWDMASRQATVSIDAHENGVRAIEFRDDSSVFATGGRDGTVALWETDSGSNLWRTDAGCERIYSLRFLAGHTSFASAGTGGVIRIRAVEDGSLLEELHGHEGRIWSLSVDPTGARLASGGDDHTVRVWFLDEDRAPLILRGHEDGVYAVAFSPDGKRIASGGRDRILRIWNANTGEFLDEVRRHGQFITSLAWHPLGHRLATGSWFRTIRLWETSPLGEILTIHDHPTEVRDVVFSPSGRYLASGGHDHIVRLWDGAPID